MMKTVEARGTHRRIGHAVGEHLRDEIREHIAGFVQPDAAGQARRVALLRRSLEQFLPQVLEQLEGMAEGAGIVPDEILALNLPMGVGEWMVDPQGCTNIAFAAGPNGPLWGKNNDGGFPRASGSVVKGEGPRPAAVLKLFPDDGVPALCVTFCGWLSGGDMMNAEGLAGGHSSVGSRFAQDPRHVSVLHWMYWLMLTSRSAREYIEKLISLPVYGKGFTQLVADRHGTVLSAEIACPLVQVRRPAPGEAWMNCVNHYQLPALEGRDRREPPGLANSKARQALLEQFATRSDRSLTAMATILRHHGSPSICRHGGDDMSHTEYSMIGVAAENRMLVADGNPCSAEYVSYAVG